MTTKYKHLVLSKKTDLNFKFIKITVNYNSVHFLQHTSNTLAAKFGTSMACSIGRTEYFLLSLTSCLKFAIDCTCDGAEPC